MATLPTSPCIITSYVETHDGCCNLTDEHAIITALQHETFAWVHLDAAAPTASNWLTCNTGYLDQTIHEALLADETRPRFTQYGNGILLIVRGVNLNPNADPEDMVSLRIWVDPHRIITTRRRPLATIQELQKVLDTNNTPLNATQFLGLLMEKLFLKLEPVLEELEDAVDTLEAKLLESPDRQQRVSIAKARRDIIAYRRYLAPQRDAIRQLANCTLPWLAEAERQAFTQRYDQLARYVEDLDALRERTQILQDELSNTLADRLNQNMYLLSIITAIFLPLGFLTGLLGVNVGGIPGVENDNAFAIMVVGLIVIVALQMWYFKVRNWF